MKLKIKVTKEILKASKWCGVGDEPNIPTSCAIALAIRDIFPLAYIRTGFMYFNINDVGNACAPIAAFSQSVTDYIEIFDFTESDERPNLPEFEFEINVPEKIIETINIDEIKPLLENHPTLELIS